MTNKKGSLVKKRSLAESGESSKPKKSRGRDPLDTLRFLPLDDGPMITRYLVECYTRQFGQDLFMIVNEEKRYIDVRFANKESADNVKSKFQDPKHRPPFKMVLTNTIDGSQIITPGEVTMYQPPRDLDHDDTQPSLPVGWNNPNPVTFEFSKEDQAADVAPQAADVAPPAAVAAPEADVARAVQHSNPETAKQSRQPRVKARYPPTAQPPPPSSLPPFEEPEWPTPPTYATP